MPTEAEILDVARREVSPEHFNDFEPIVKGPLFAVVALIPLGILAVACLVSQKLTGNRR